MDLLSFMSCFECCKNFSPKIKFSESNFLEVYAVVLYTWIAQYDHITKASGLLLFCSICSYNKSFRFVVVFWLILFLNAS